MGEGHSFCHLASQPASKQSLSTCSGQGSVLRAMEYPDELDADFILKELNLK